MLFVHVVVNKMSGQCYKAFADKEKADKLAAELAKQFMADPSFYFEVDTVPYEE